MAHYLIKFSFTPEALAKVIESQEDRRPIVSALCESVGGKLHGYWYAFGDADGYVVVEAPDNVSGASLAATVASSGSFSKFETTVLLTVEEALQAFAKAKSIRYQPPGG